MGETVACWSGRAKAKTLTWVQGDRGEVVLEVLNSLGTALQISDLRLVVEGVEALLPATGRLLPEPGAAGTSSHSLSLTCVPRSPGILRLTV